MDQQQLTIEQKESILLDFLRNTLEMTADTSYHAQSDTVDDWVKAVEGRYVDSEQVKFKLCKNFFLNHKKKKQNKFYGVACTDTNVEMNVLSKNLGLGSGNLRFADSAELTSYLDILPGNVTPLAFHLLHPSVQAKRPDVLISTEEKPSIVSNMKTLTIIVDAKILRKRSKDPQTTTTTLMLLFHPLHNCASTSLSQDEFIKYFKECLGEEAWNQVIVYDFETNIKLSVNDV